MKKAKSFVFMLLLGVFALLSACSSTSSAGQAGETGPKPQAEGSQPSAAPETIVVGATTTGAPFTFLNTKTNEIDGVMVDMANKIAEHIGAKAEIKQTKFSALIPSLQSGKINIISAGMLMTAEKKEVIDFSEPVYQYGEGLVVAAGNESIKSFDDLKGKKVGAQEGTVFLKGVQQEKDITVTSYKSIADMIVELKNGRIDAFLADQPVMVHMIRENKDLGVQLVDGYQAKWPGDVGIGVPKGADELREKINKAIETMKSQGEIDSILKKWGL